MLTETNADSNVFALGIELRHVWELETTVSGHGLRRAEITWKTNSSRSVAFAFWVRMFSNASEAEEKEGFPFQPPPKIKLNSGRRTRRAFFVKVVP